MDAIVNKLSSARDKLMPGTHLIYIVQYFNVVLVDHSLKIKKEQKNPKKHKIQNRFIKIN